MDTKISSTFWSDPDIEAAPAETKLAALWLLTNERIGLCGYAEVTPSRFAFETGALPEGLARALTVLAKSFPPCGKGYWARNFIGYQFGRENALARNNMRFPIVEELLGLPAEVQALVLAEYPELKEAFDKASSTALAHPSPTHVVGVRVGVGVREGTRVRARAGAGAGSPEGSMPARARRAKDALALIPEAEPEPAKGRLLALNAIFRRQAATAWSAADVRALEASGLLKADPADFGDAVETVRAFYHAEIPREMERQFWRRTTLGILLNNWGGELDKARAWAQQRARQAAGEGHHPL